MSISKEYFKSNPNVKDIEIARGAIIPDHVDNKYKNKKIELRAYHMKDGTTKYKVIVWKRKDEHEAWSISRDSRRKLNSVEAFYYFGQYIKEKCPDKKGIRYYNPK